MSIRLRITFVFTLLVFIILGLVSASIYYFSYTSRIKTVKIRLTNRAITVARLLSQSNVFSNELIQRIDSSTSMAFINLVMEAYNYKNNKIYSYTSLPGDSLEINQEMLDEARVKGDIYLVVGKKDVVAYHYTDDHSRFIMFAGGEDQDGKGKLLQLQKILLLSFLGGLVIAFMGGYFFSMELLKPIKKIADEVNDISAKNFSNRIETGQVKDEWNYLSDTLNALLNRLQESFELQKRFIANASHELSTPLTSISSQIEVSLQRERTAEDYRLVMKSVHQDVLHMTKLTQMLLQIAKASGTEGGLELAPVRIDEIIFRIPSEITKINKDYSVSLDLEELPYEEAELIVFGNEELLYSAVKNIVINACKYSANSLAILKLSVEKDQIILAIQDTGIGMPENELAHIFQPFYRMNDNEVKEGFGLGLSLASRIVKLHKGEVKVVSVIGKGTTFTIKLPVKRTIG